MLFASADDAPQPWIDAFAALMPELEIRVWPECGAESDIEFALVWRPPPAMLARFSGLKIVFSLGAGVEHVLDDPQYPAGVKLVRMVDPGLKAGMTEFVVMRVLHYHRRMPEYEAQQKAGEWRLLPQTLPGERRIGLLGLGQLGAAAAEALARFGFDVAGWSRGAKAIPGVKSYTGEDGLFELLERSEILVNLLPLTPQTADILDSTTLGALPEGAFLINVGRGAQLVDEDLLAALDSGHLAGATLDVFRTEPLPADNPWWTHPKVFVMPHAAAWTLPQTAAKTVTDNIARYRAGDAMENLVDVKRGY